MKKLNCAIVTAFLTFNSFQSSASAPKSCDLSEKATRFRIVSSQTNTYASINYTLAVEELKKQCYGGQISEPQWRGTEIVLRTEYGYWESYCSKSKSGAELRKSVCGKIYSCIAEAQPNEDILWLKNKTESLRCETLNEDDQSGQDGKYKNQCYSYIGKISCHDKLDEPECSFVYTYINENGERVTDTVNTDVGYYPYEWVVTIPFAPIALPIMLQKSKNAAHKLKNQMIAQKCLNATIDQDKN